MVGRLVEEEEVGLLQEEARQRDAAPLAAGERLDVGVAGGQRSASSAISMVRSELPPIGVHRSSPGARPARR